MEKQLFEKLLQQEQETKQKARMLETRNNETCANAKESLKNGQLTLKEYEQIAYDDQPYYEIEVLKVMAQYLHDAARYEFITYALNEWKKAAKPYNGKPLGEKTKEKINEVLRNKNIYFYVNYGYNNHDLKFGYLALHENGEKYNSLDFSYNDDLTIYSKYNEPFLIDHNTNKINLDGVYNLPTKRNLKGTYKQWAQRLVKQRQKLEKIKQEYNKQVSLFNALTPRNYESIKRAQ